MTPPYVYVAAAVVALLFLMIVWPRKRRAELNLELTSPGSMPAKPLPGRNFARVIAEAPPMERVSIYSVNGDTPFFFTEQGKTGFYIPEGNVEIKAEYFWPKRGVMYTTETSSSGVKKVLVTPVEGRTYYLSFATDKETFVIS